MQRTVNVDDGGQTVIPLPAVDSCQQTVDLNFSFVEFDQFNHFIFHSKDIACLDWSGA